MKKLFYLQDTRTSLDGTALFWLPEGSGYTSNLNKAVKYTLTEAQAQHSCRETDLPLLVSEVNKYSVLRLDYQNIPNTEDTHTQGSYFIRVMGAYKGNDIGFLGPKGKTVFDVATARLFSLEVATQLCKTRPTQYQPIKYNTVLSCARATFQISNINIRTMITKPGIVRITGKTIDNCPTCGKITRSYNPYGSAYYKKNYYKETTSGY